MNLNQQQFDEGCNKILSNTKDMLEDSKILFENNRWARSYYMSCMAEEEIGKYAIVITVHAMNISGYDTSKIFKKTFTYHGPKRILGIFISDTIPKIDKAFPSKEDILSNIDLERAKIDENYLIDEISKHVIQNLDLEKLSEEMTKIDEKILEDLKLSSMYVDFDDTTNKFSVPIDCITKEMADSNLKIVKEKFDNIKDFQEKIMGQIEIKDNFIKILESIGAKAYLDNIFI